MFYVIILLIVIIFLLLEFDIFYAMLHLVNDSVHNRKRKLFERNDKSASSNCCSVSDEEITASTMTIASEESINEIRILIVEEGNREHVLYKLSQGNYLELRLGSTLFGYKIKVFTNYPLESEEFIRDQYHELHEYSQSSYRIYINKSGSFRYYVVDENRNEYKGSGYILVEPKLSLNGEDLPLNCVQCVTYISKYLGPFCNWQDKLKVAEKAGYNLVHFTPIQELGDSKSAYSLRDQLKINSSFETDKKLNINDITSFTNKLRNQYKMLSLCDIVLNHTANESEWLQEHPECTYNLENCPYLKSAYLLDITLHNFALEISKGLWEFSGIPVIINDEQHLNAIRYALLEKVLKKTNIHELYTIDVEATIMEFLSKCRNRGPPLNAAPIYDSSKLKIVYDPQYRRLSATVDMEMALGIYNVFRNDCFDEETRLQRCSFDFKNHLETLNAKQREMIDGYLTSAVDNCIGGIRYFRVQSDGPKWLIITEDRPLFPRYFTDYNDETLEEHMYSQNARFIMAHNGWIINGDPLKNFAAQGSVVYLKRELIAWGDSVKLRYGESANDCPYLWSRMRKYVEEMAQAFDGIRLDNCHSTPLHVAEYMLDAARKIRPNLYVLAELFTNSESTDNLFVNRLAITSLVRESMSAWSSHELGRLVYKYGGEPIGAFKKSSYRKIGASVANALFLDLTHDNPSPIEKRSVYDMLPSSALVCMSCCGVGSNMGYDELVPHHIDVVEEDRLYMNWGMDQINEKTGILAAKSALNRLHYYLGKNGYTQVFVDQIDSDIVCVTRHNEITHESVIMISYTSFSFPNPFVSGSGRTITVSGLPESVLIEGYLKHKSGERFKHFDKFTKNTEYINGLTEYELVIKTDFSWIESEMVRLETSESTTRVNLTDMFKPGSVVAIKFVQNDAVKGAVRVLSTLQNVRDIVGPLTLADLNKVLFCCEGEDGGTYNIPGWKSLVYSGLQGIISEFEKIAIENDLGHPLCDNLRNGCWLADYTVSRLKNKQPTRKLGEFLENTFEPLKDIPKFLVPCYFELQLTHVYQQLLHHAYSIMSPFIQNGSEFCKRLALSSIEFAGAVDSSPLPPLSRNLRESPISPTVTLSAGLPHFATGYMRNWGRDTFISIRGLFLLTGRFNEARYIILAYGGCLRHGLIPNLLDSGRNPRYNCRDAVWWWLYTIQNYVTLAPDGPLILNDYVNRIFPTDESEATSEDQRLQDVMQEALTVHFQGLCFRERNAGTAIDAHMKSQGFDNQIGVHPLTGFVFGGNEFNCGTWMDKMGSSDRAGNRGKPATPRDGSAIELIALSYATVKWLSKLHKEGKYSYIAVNRKNKDGADIMWNYTEWSEKIKRNFENQFWIPLQEGPNDSKLIHHRGIYKDSVGATQKWADYQLRPNYAVAMAIAPDLFTPENAWAALNMSRKWLLGPLGMKTLDPDDWNYRGFYDNSDDSSDPNVAHGFNYHQGPEWLWPVGFYLRARLYFASKVADGKYLKETVLETKAYLSRHYVHLEESPWKGLPELTNERGIFCPFSCATQAWSVSSILEVIHDINELEK